LKLALVLLGDAAEAVEVEVPVAEDEDELVLLVVELEAGARTRDLYKVAVSNMVEFLDHMVSTVMCVALWKVRVE
jgi:hypothetical protein